MVTQYTLDHRQLDALGITNIRDLAMKGDISPIMEDYELAIKSPIKNVVVGELPRLILVCI
jgi:nuclear-control-of-ATPase protein 2